MNHTKLLRLIICALFAAVLCVFSPLVIPVGPIPFAMQIFAVMLCAVTLPWAQAQTSVFVYLLLGLFLPLFSGGKTGLMAIPGPTGGYIWSYLLMVPVISLFRAIPIRNRWAECAWSMLGCAAAIALCYLCGTAQFSLVTNSSFSHALAVCVVPFIGFDLVKALAATVLGVELRRALSRISVISAA